MGIQIRRTALRRRYLPPLPEGVAPQASSPPPSGSPLSAPPPRSCASSADGLLDGRIYPLRRFLPAAARAEATGGVFSVIIASLKLFGEGRGQRTSLRLSPIGMAPRYCALSFLSVFFFLLAHVTGALLTPRTCPVMCIKS
eukprot:1466724-Rhodomonas_salina.2